MITRSALVVMTESIFF